MRVAAKIVTILVLAALATPVVFFLGCGSENTNCGGCPADSAAPFGATISGDEMVPATIPDGVAGCVSNLTFTVVDPDGISPMNDICVEIFTNGLVALADASGNCTINPNYAGYIRTRTGSGGTVSVDFTTGTLLCGGLTADQDIDFFVQVSSCSAGAVSSATWTLTCP